MNKEKNNNVYKYLKILFLIISVIISLIFLFGLKVSGFLPGKYMIIFIILTILLNILFVFLVLRSKKSLLNVIGILLVIIISTVMVVGFNYVNKTYNVIKELLTDNEEEMLYYTLVLQDSDYDELGDLIGLKMGILDQNSSSVKEKISESVSVNYETYDSLGDLVYSLQLKDIEAITVSESVYNILLEEYEDFNNLFKRIGEIKIYGNSEKTESDIKLGSSFILYISGLDSRDTETIHSSGLSDVNILAVVNPKNHKILLVNVPRDYYVQLHNTTGLKDKLTHAGLYGIATSKSTIEDLFNVKVNAYVKVNFAAVTTIVDEIDGVDIYSDITFNSFHKKGFVVKQGKNHFNGEEALAYARERYAYTSGDRHRGENQQQIITAVINKMMQNKTYLLKYTDILESVEPYISTNIKMEVIQGLAKNQLDSMAKWDVVSISVDGTNSYNYTRSFPKQKSYVMEPTQKTIDNAKEKISSTLRG